MATKRKSPKKPRTQPAKTVAYEIRDAKHVDEMLGKHAAKVAKKGVTPEKRKQFEATIDEAEAHDLPAGPVGIPSRDTLKDLIGDYRDAADLASDGMEGVDEELRRTLKASGEFPDTDALLEQYVLDLMPIVRAHARLLSECDFPKEKADQLEKTIAAYLAELKANPGERSAVTDTNQGRAAIFRRLRLQTRYLRKAGRKALKKSAQRADFDRVQVNLAKVKKAKKAASAKAKAKRAAAKATKGGGSGK